MIIRNEREGNGGNLAGFEGSEAEINISIFPSPKTVNK